MLYTYQRFERTFSIHLQGKDMMVKAAADSSEVTVPVIKQRHIEERIRLW
jgi:hypothetical protein